MSAAAVPLPLAGTQLQAIGALLAGQSAATVARDCGISDRTLRNWLRQPGFRAALVDGQSQLLNQTYLQLAAAATEAVQALVEVCQDSNQRGSVRVAAAGKILDLLFRRAPQFTGPAAQAASAPNASPAPQPAEADARKTLSLLFAPTPPGSALSPAAAPAEFETPDLAGDGHSSTPAPGDHRPDPCQLAQALPRFTPRPTPGEHLSRPHRAVPSDDLFSDLGAARAHTLKVPTTMASAK